MNKKAIAVQYTQTVFTAYTSDNDLVLLSLNIESYAEKKATSEIQSVEVKKLNSIDLYHFGWNIWNHFRIGNQLQMAAFLKKVFPSILGLFYQLNQIESISTKQFYDKSLELFNVEVRRSGGGHVVFITDEKGNPTRYPIRISEFQARPKFYLSARGEQKVQIQTLV